MKRRDVLLGAPALAGCSMWNDFMDEDLPRPIVIAHRGASGERPEHTLAAYRLAIQQGADFIEPDLVMTRDGVLVCRHENEISGTTDVADRPEFADRRAEKTVDGVTAAGWWAEDFTLAELKALRCKERLPQLRPQNTAFDGQETIPTFTEALTLAQASNVGIYPELKHPNFLRAQGLDPVAALVEAVRVAGGQSAADIMFVQCFEVAPLQQLAAMSSLRWRSIQLIAATGGPWDRQDLSYAAMLTTDGLRRIAGYAVGIGPEKSLILPRDASGRSTQATNLVARAHEAGLLAHPWTFRAENYFLPTELRTGDPAAGDFMRAHGNIAAELRLFQRERVDGVFCDFPALAAAAFR
jgi:glycerophosphoryl diester phosphodiesterase